MKGRHRAPLAVGHQHRNAVGGLDGEQQAGLIGHQSVGLPGPLRGRRPQLPQREDQIRVNLAEGNQRRSSVSGDRFGQQPAVLGYRLPLVARR